MYVVGITSIDILVSFLFIILCIPFFYLIKKSVTNIYSEKYYFKFLIFKLICAILFCILHIYIYKGGDTFLYFSGGNFIANQVINEPSSFLKFVFGNFEDFNQIFYSKDFSIINYFSDPSTLIMCQITSIFSLLSFNNYMAATILMCIISFLGIWLFYSTMCKLYPNLSKAFTICILFYPSIGIWGSGILKDTITIAAVGFIFFSTYNLLHKKNFISSIIIILVSIFFCLKLKPYILYTFVPAMLAWSQAQVSHGIKNNFLNFIITPILIISVIAGGILFIQNVSDDAGKYSIDNVQSVAEGFQSWHTYLADTRDQSGYTLGKVEFTPTGVLKKAPEAFFVTYFRPFPFVDTRNFATFFEAIQSFSLLSITIFILLKVGILNFLKTIYTNPEVRAFMIFSIILGIAVGLTSYNFGALSRYKIPCLPFFTTALAIIYYQNITKKTIH